MDSEDTYAKLKRARERLLELNSLSSTLSEIEAIDDAINRYLESETAPCEPSSFVHEHVLELEKRLRQCEASKIRLSSSLTEQRNSREIAKLFNSAKIGIVGGHPTDVKALKDAILAQAADAKIKFKETFEGAVPPHRDFREKYQGVDVLVALTGFTGHAMTKHVDLLEQEANVPIIRVDSASRDIKQLIQDIVAILKERRRAM